MEEDRLEGAGSNSPSSATVSRPIPIQRNRSDRGAGPLSSPSYIQSAPAPRAPIIGSLKPPSFLNGRMPSLELPPQSPGARSIGVSNNYARSAPTTQFLLSSKKPILHALQISQRRDSASSLDGAGGRSLGRRHSSSARNRRVSFDDEVGHGVLFEADEEEFDSAEECEGSELVSNEGLMMVEEGGAGSTEVFSAIRSLSMSATEKSYLSARLDEMNLKEIPVNGGAAGTDGAAVGAGNETVSAAMPDLRLSDADSQGPPRNLVDGEMVFSHEDEEEEGLEQDDIVQFDMDGA